MTNFTLSRQADTTNSTWGILSDDTGMPLCKTLERGLHNADGHPRIPAGTYEVVRKPFGASKFDHGLLAEMGAAYKGILWLPNVPGRENIECHPANFFHELLGCIALGESVATEGADFCVVSSRIAYHRVYPTISAAIDGSGGLSFVITDPST